MPTRKRVIECQGGSGVSNIQAFSVREFFTKFGSDHACLTRVMEVRYGLRHVCAKCGKEATFHKLADRRAFSCAQCGRHIHPCGVTVSLQPYVAAGVIQRDLFLRRDPAWRVRQGAAAREWPVFLSSMWLED